MPTNQELAFKDKAEITDATPLPTGSSGKGRRLIVEGLQRTRNYIDQQNQAIVNDLPTLVVAALPEIISLSSLLVFAEDPVTHNLTATIDQAAFREAVRQLLREEGGAISNSSPEARNVLIGGSYQQGQPLTVTFTHFDADGDAKGMYLFQWYRADTVNGTRTRIAGATSATYTLVLADVDKYLQCDVSPRAATGTLNGVTVSSPYTPLIAASSAGPALSSNFADWQPTNMLTPAVGGQPDPRGGNTAYRLVPNTTNGVHEYRTTITGMVAGSIYYVTMDVDGGSDFDLFYLESTAQLTGSPYTGRELFQMSTTKRLLNIPGHAMENIGTGTARKLTLEIKAQGGHDIFLFQLRTTGESEYASDGTKGVLVSNVKIALAS